MGRVNYKGYDLPDGLAIPDVPDDLRTLVDSGPIPRFANAAARSAALTSPPAGAMTYQIDSGRLELYNGTTWRDASGLPAGLLSPYAGAVEPPGWLICDGRAISRVAYADLFAAVASAYGPGDGSTTFNIPDLRGRVPVGMDNLGGVTVTDPNRQTGGALGGAAGAKTHALTDAELAAHMHGIPGTTGAGGGHAHGAQAPYQFVIGDIGFSTLHLVADAGSDAAGAVGVTYNEFTAAVGDHSHSVPPLTNFDGGANVPHNNMPPYICVGYLIKT